MSKKRDKINEEELKKWLRDEGFKVGEELDESMLNKAICIACLDGHLDIVKYLVEHGVDINKANLSGEISLHWACSMGHKNIVKYLLEQGADVNKEDDYGETPLFRACLRRDLDIVECLLKHGAEVNKCYKYGKTLLHLACENGCTSIVKCLLKHKAEVDKIDFNGRTPLHWACSKGNLDIVKSLLAKVYGSDKIISLLLRHKNKIPTSNKFIENIVNIVDNWGMTPLYIAASGKNKEMAKLLLNNGARICDANKIDKDIIEFLDKCKEKDMYMTQEVFSNVERDISMGN